MPQPLMPKKLKLNGLWWSTRSSRTTPKKRCHFHHRELECKSRNQEIHEVTGKLGTGEKNNEAGQKLTEFCQENALVTANIFFQQHKTQLYTWTSPGGQYQNQIDHILWSQRWKSSMKSTKTRPVADCAQSTNSLLPNSDLNWRK